jgi:hypothetical protein
VLKTTVSGASLSYGWNVNKVLQRRAHDPRCSPLTRP